MSALWRLLIVVSMWLAPTAAWAQAPEPVGVTSASPAVPTPSVSPGQSDPVARPVATSSPIAAVPLHVAAAPSKVAAAPATRRHWYGGETLVADVSSLALGVVCFGVEASSGPYNRGSALAIGLGVTAGAGYLFGAGGVHLVHGHPDKAVFSFVLRLLPPALTWGGLTTQSCDGWESCRPNYAVITFGMTMFPVVMLIDALVIAREDAPPDRSAGVAVRPWVALSARRGELGLGGTF